jgi:drug/metabolite transporter (DMT)-like permease
VREKSNFLAYIFLLLTVTFWAGNFIVGKFASYYEVPPFSLNFYRWFFAWLILAPFTISEILKKKEYIFQNYKLFIILGVTSITIFNSIVYYSLNFTQVISGVLMISTIPVMIMFFSFILKIEKTNTFQIIGVILSFLGVIIIITKADFEILKNLNFNKGDITMVVAMFSWALYSTLLKRQKYELSQLSLLQVVMTFGLIFLIPVYFIEYQVGYRIKLDTAIYLNFIIRCFVTWSRFIYIMDQRYIYDWSKSIWSIFALDANIQRYNGYEFFLMKNLCFIIF